MKILHRIFENVKSKDARTVMRELDRLNLSYKIDGKFLDFSTFELDEHFPEIDRLIQKKKLHVQTGVFFDEHDLENADWFYINSSEEQYPQPEGTFIEETYDISEICSRCGYGKQQIAPFRLKSDFKNNHESFHGLYWVHDEIFIRPKAKLILEEESISGFSCLHPVIHITNKPVENIYQMKIHKSKEPGLITNDLEKRICQPAKRRPKQETTRYKAFGVDQYRDDLPYCGNIRYLYPRRDMIRFRQEMFKDKTDIFKTHELFGYGFGHYLILVNQRFFQIVKKHKLKGLVFRPVGLQ